ncbi:hypothetical protein [Faecalicatena contorta]|uniref:Uncharacterized protein n=1 Tax=Faecalicatena contorta TaxID=39482 RepID=A0A316A0V3_9FIRM|nr:hypothetical protein [Faecalicatena contorta]PWJ50858.1 hypothetical protein A8805_103154 [Faecalicatena contorta]SUQ13426.1 hypothetical protein SAMN05216529_103154 [Faecalicatena contorta]
MSAPIVKPAQEYSSILYNVSIDPIVTIASILCLKALTNLLFQTRMKEAAVQLAAACKMKLSIEAKGQ